MSLQFLPFFTSYCLQLDTPSVLHLCVNIKQCVFKGKKKGGILLFLRNNLPGGTVKMRIPVDKPNTSTRSAAKSKTKMASLPQVVSNW